ncbi:hypothetical protein C7R57_02030 [Macrococcoides caseolyticum subsp. caseolyticum]|uniref:SpoOB alpha-helical domain-containing protein n=2 Tax=Macrococcoides caseolyticum TaxID=69966 RepID=A0A855H3X8_9STAP|nr:hypothetical protein CW719_09385 [Macrococcus caseolyticus]RAK47909.1 hypothetical protein C7R57_02030 [Macrococcus caseolyticus subsp. caseolyticus]PKE07698.1 hypothetical protein CW692_02255 [Macrococcus caseolyticus]PKE18079.1 hypothetical protein CW718_01760 [Macrococcus caseolyticus]PKE19987.1 hypothetical protein CW679_01500 [Macrococcus caseolyticus]
MGQLSQVFFSFYLIPDMYKILDDFVCCPFFNDDNIVRLTYTKCYSMLYYVRGEEMNRRDIYFKMKHDFANQLQLIDTYTQLGQHEKRDKLIQSVVMSFKDEQDFLKLPLNQTIDCYIGYRIEQHKFDFAFEIDTLSSAIGLYDTRVSSIFNDVFADAGHRIEEKGLITISIFETEAAFELLFVLTGRIIDKTIHPAITEMNQNLVEYEYEINKRGV